MDKFDQEMSAAIDWAWTEGMNMIDAKDEQFEEVSAHVEMCFTLMQVLLMLGWGAEELHQMVDDAVELTAEDGEVAMH